MNEEIKEKIPEIEKQRQKIIDEVEKNTLISVCADIENNIARREIELDILKMMLKSYTNTLEKM